MSRPRILIVDDQKLNLEILMDLLEADYELSVALDGDTALRLVHENPPALILLDVRLAGIDGYEVCRRVKAHPVTRKIPVIFLTALAEVADEERGLALGAADYITKPFSGALVKARISNQLKVASQRDQLIHQEKMASLGTMMNKLAHELNTPLGNTLLALSLQEEGLEKMMRQSAVTEKEQSLLRPYFQRTEEVLGVVRRNLERAINLVTTVRQVFENLGTDEVASFSVMKCLRDTLDLQADTFVRAGIRAELEGPESLDVRTFPGALAQAVNQMVRNTIRYGRSAPDSRISLRVTAEADRFDLVYQDSGSGVSAELLKVFFEPFHAALGGHNSPGLGAFVLYSLVTDRLKGTIRAESPPGEGLKLLLSLPRELPMPND